VYTVQAQPGRRLPDDINYLFRVLSVGCTRCPKRSRRQCPCAKIGAAETIVQMLRTHAGRVVQEPAAAASYHVLQSVSFKLVECPGVCGAYLEQVTVLT